MPAELDPAAVSARLDVVRAAWHAGRRGPVDMSPEAVSRRLREVQRATRLCRWLGGARAEESRAR